MGSPLEALFPRTRRLLLTGFFRQPGRRFYLREVQRLVGTGRGAVQRELASLAEAGILRREEEHGRVFFSANPESPIFADLRAIVDKTSGLAFVLTDALATIEGISVAFVFGSVARGEARPDSDVDLAVVGTVSFREVVSALSDAQARLGREINPMVFTSDDLGARIDSDDAFVREVMRGTKLFIVGTEDDLRAVAE
jgi:predicted nucleotidyltransferase